VDVNGQNYVFERATSICKDQEIYFLLGIAIPDVNSSVTNPYAWCGGVYCDCYISPKEICWMPWKKRYDSRLTEDFPEIHIHSAIESCTYYYEDSGDACFDLPSALIRELLGICKCQ